MYKELLFFEIKLKAQEKMIAVININKKQENLTSFESNRTDRKILEQLTGDQGSLIDPKKRKILKLIDKLSKNSRNAQFFLDTARKLQYGTRKGSVLDAYLNSRSSIKDKEQKQNTDFEEALRIAARKTIDNSDPRVKPELEKQYEEIFIPDEEQKLSYDEALKKALESRNPRVQNEIAAIKLREKIVNSSLIQQAQSEEDKKHAKSITNSLDYFLASSETPVAEKVQCLKVLNHMASPEYKIHPQLKDKKLQAIDEITRDLIVKVPDEEKKTLKQVDQRKHGMCAAISMVRQALPYEYKLAYLTNIAAELDDKPTMEVFDTTNPTKKVEVEKANINYDYATRMDYRIIDASALNWMNIADRTSGNTKAGYYEPFGEKKWKVFHDSHLVLDMDEPYKPAQNTLRSLIKLKKNIESIDEYLEERKYLQEVKQDFDKKMTHAAYQAYSRTESAIREAFPEIEADKTRNIATKILEPQKTIDNTESKLKTETSPEKREGLDRELKFLKENRIDRRDSEFDKKLKISSILVSEAGYSGSEKMEKAINDIYKSYSALEKEKSLDRKISSINKIKKTKKEWINDKKADYYKNLFNLAAAYRVKKEFESQIPAENKRLALEFNLPSNEVQASKRLEELSGGIANIDDNKLENLAKIAGTNNDKQEIKQAVDTAYQNLKTEIPRQSEEILKEIGYGDQKKLLKDLASFAIEQIDAHPEAKTTSKIEHTIFDNLPEEKRMAGTFLNETIRQVDTSKDDKELNSLYKAHGLENPLDRTLKALEMVNEKLLQKRDNEVALLFGVNPNESSIKSAIEKEKDRHVLSRVAKLLDTDKKKDNMLKTLSKTEDKLVKAQIADELGLIAVDLEPAKKTLSGITEKITDLLSKQSESLSLANSEEVSGLVKTSSTGELIVQTFENRKEILSRDDLDYLQNRADDREVYVYRIKNGEKPEGPDLRDLSQKDKNLFKAIEDNYTRIKRETTRDYGKYNNELKEINHKFYRKRARMTGFNFSPEEGRSGLTSVQEIENFARATGKVSASIADPEKVIKHLENGEGGAIFNAMVETNNFSSHAMCSDDVGTIAVKNPQTGKTDMTKTVYTINSWGGNEDEFSWKDSLGVRKTDYGKGRGPQGGFILKPDDAIGYPVDSLYEFGVNKPDLMLDHALRKFDISKHIKYSMFCEGILFEKPAPKLSSAVYGSLGFFTNARDIPIMSSTIFDVLTDRNEEVNQPITNTKTVISTVWSSLDESKVLLKIARGEKINESEKFGPGREHFNVNLPEGIKTKEDFDKIPEDHPLKLNIRKTLIEKRATPIIGRHLEDTAAKQGLSGEDRTKLMGEKYIFEEGDLFTARKNSEIDRFVEKLAGIQKDNIVNFFAQVKNGKTFDGKPVRQISNASGLEEKIDGVMAKDNIKEITDWIDKRFDPVNDDDFMKTFNELKNNPDKLKQELENSTNQELGLEFGNEYRFAKRLYNHGKNAEDEFMQTISISKYFSTIDKMKTHRTDNGKIRECSQKEKFDLINDRNFETNYFLATSKMMSLSTKRHNDIRLMAEKEGIKYIPPELKVFSDDEIKNMVLPNLDAIESSIETTKEIKLAVNNEENIKNLKENISKTSDLTVRSFVIKHKRNKVKGLMSQWISSKIKGENDKKTDKLKIELMKEISDGFITKHPQEFMDQLLVDLPKMKKDNEVDKSVSTFWKMALEKSLSTAGKLSLENNLLKITESGQMHQVARELNPPEGEKTESSEKGLTFKSPEILNMISICLFDPANNNSTLKLYVDQMGLTDDMTKYMLNKAIPEELSSFQEHGKKLVALNSCKNLIAKVFKKEIENPAGEGSNPKDMLDNYYQKLDEAFKKEENPYMDKALVRYKKIFSRNLPEEGNLTVKKISATHSMLNKIMDKRAKALESKWNEDYFLTLKNGQVLGSIMELLPDNHELKEQTLKCVVSLPHIANYIKTETEKYLK